LGPFSFSSRRRIGSDGLTVLRFEGMLPFGMRLLAVGLAVT